MIETRRLKNVAIFIQTILSFVLSRKNIHIRQCFKKITPPNFYGNLTVKNLW